jgi:hypothetical protein
MEAEESGVLIVPAASFSNGRIPTRVVYTSHEYFGGFLCGLPHRAQIWESFSLAPLLLTKLVPWFLLILRSPVNPGGAKARTEAVSRFHVKSRSLTLFAIQR